MYWILQHCLPPESYVPLNNAGDLIRPPACINMGNGERLVLYRLLKLSIKRLYAPVTVSVVAHSSIMEQWVPLPSI